MPVAGERAALLVSQDAINRTGFVRVISQDHAVGPTAVLVNRFVVGGFAGQPTLLLTSDGDELCVGPLSDRFQASSCVPVRPTLFVPLEQRLILLEPRLKQPPEPSAPETKFEPPHKRSAKHGPGQRAVAPAGTAASRRQPAAKRRSSRKRKRPKPPDEIDVWLQRVDAQGQFEGDAEETGLSFARPLPGMDLAGAAEARDGIRLLWYEHAKTHQGVRRARLRTGRLDAEGRYLPATRSTLFEGERKYGYLDGHSEARLFSRSGHVAYVGRFARTSGPEPRTGFEAFRLRPLRKIDAPAALCGVDPFALSSPAGLAPAEQRVLEAVWQREPQLADGQPRWHAEHVAWVADRGYFQVGGELHSVGRQRGAMRREPPPFVANRSRIYWSALDPSGAGLARTHAGYTLLSEAGELTAQVVASGDRGGGAEAAAAQDVELPPAVRIGDSWWALRPAGAQGSSPSGYRAVRLLPTPGEAASHSIALHPDTAMLVGGAEHGLIVTRRVAARGPGRLLLWRLDADGQVTPLGKPLTSVLPGFAATQRRDGGAIIAGESAAQAGRLEVLAVDGQGAVIQQGECPLRLERGARRLQLHPLPGGGALLGAPASHEVVWLDDDGREVARALRPADSSGASCIDGRAAPRWVATTQPGQLLKVDALAAAGSCVVGQPQWAADGSLRWFGSSVSGVHSRAEVGVLSAATLFGRSATPPPRSARRDDDGGSRPPLTTAPDHAPPAPCPPDMVAVRGQLCVDRFETRLADDRTGLALSPDYPATPNLATITQGRWVMGRWQAGDLHAQAIPLPPLLRPRDSKPSPVARSLGGVRPSGYLTGLVAERACRTAGKRLCKPEEFLLACRGQQNRKYPYGDSYEPGACNVYRYGHPAAALHGNPSVGHLDPRLNRVHDTGEPLLRLTGATPRCRSQWGDDFIYDMVGNLDEWVDEKKGAFAGGFYSRLTREGCDALITAHPRRYLDYSTGTRCCRDAVPVR